MWVAADGSIVAVDFGIMGRLDWDTRRYLADMLIATLEGDYHRLAAVYMEAGYLPQSHALDLFAQALRSVRSEEHTSEIQSLISISYAVFCLNKNNNINNS